MKELIITNKQEYLNNYYPYAGTPKLTDEMRCIHCDHIFSVGDYKVFKYDTGDEFICCPNSPDCDGTVMDWVLLND